MDLICIYAFHSRLFLPDYFMLKSLSINLRKMSILRPALLLLKPV